MKRKPRNLCRSIKKQKIPKHYVYKGFLGTINYSMNDRCFFGKIDKISDVVSYEADNLNYLEEAFQEAVDDYILIKEML